MHNGCRTQFRCSPWPEQRPGLGPRLRRLLGPDHAARGEGERWVGRSRPTTGVVGGRRIPNTRSESANGPERGAGPFTARRRHVCRGSSPSLSRSRSTLCLRGAGPRSSPRPRGRSDPPIGRALSGRTFRTGWQGRRSGSRRSPCLDEVLVGFGLGWSGEQVALMVAFVEAVTAWVARRQVTPTTSPAFPWARRCGCPTAPRRWP